MRKAIDAAWRLPWPSWLRRHAFDFATLPVVRGLLFPRFLVGVVGIIFDDQNRVLLLFHTYRETPWGLPTGFLEHAEQPIDALRREIGEETGFRVELDPSPNVITETDRPLLNIVFRGRSSGGAFEPSTEVSQARFFATNELPQMFPLQRELVLQAAKEVGH